MAMVAQQQQQQTPSREGGSRKRLQRHRAGPSKDGSTRSLSVFTNQETGGLLPRNTEVTMSMYDDDRLSTSGSVSGTSELALFEGGVNDGETVPQWAANSFYFQPTYVPISEEAHASPGDGTYQSSHSHAFQSVAPEQQGSPSMMRVATRGGRPPYNDLDSSPVQKKRATGPGQEDGAGASIRSSLAEQAELSSTDPRWRDENGNLINDVDGKHRNRGAGSYANELEINTVVNENLENARKEAGKPGLQWPENAKPKPNNSAGSSPRSLRGHRRIYDNNQLDGEGDTGDKQDGSLPRSSTSSKLRSARRPDDDEGDAEVPMVGVSDRGVADYQHQNNLQPKHTPRNNSSDDDNLNEGGRGSYRKTIKIEEANRKRENYDPVTVNVTLASGSSAPVPGQEENIYESIEYTGQHKAPLISLAHAKDSVGRESKKKDSFRRQKESNETLVPMEVVTVPTAIEHNVPPAVVVGHNNMIVPAANSGRRDEYPEGDVYDNLEVRERAANTQHVGHGPSSTGSHVGPIATGAAREVRRADGGLGGSRDSLDVEIDGNRLAAPRYVSAMDRYSPVIDIEERSPKPHHRSSVKLTPAEITTARQQHGLEADNGRRLSGDQKHGATKGQYNGSLALIGQPDQRRTLASNEVALKAVYKSDIQLRDTVDTVPPARLQSSSSGKQQARPTAMLDDPYLSSASDVPIGEQDGYQYENPVRMNQRPRNAVNNNQRPTATSQRPIAASNNRRPLYDDPSSSASSSSLTSSINANDAPYLQPNFHSYVNERPRESNNDEVYYSDIVTSQERQIAQAGNRSLPYNNGRPRQQFASRGMGTHTGGYSQRDASNSPGPGMRNSSAREFGTQPSYDRGHRYDGKHPQQQQPNNGRNTQLYDQDGYSSSDYEEPLPYKSDVRGRTHSRPNVDNMQEVPYYAVEDQGRYDVNRGRAFRPVGQSSGNNNDDEIYYALQEPRQSSGRPYSDVQSDVEQRPRYDQKQQRGYPNDIYVSGNAPNDYRDRPSFNEAPSRSRTQPPGPAAGRLYADAEYQPNNGRYGNRRGSQPQNDDYRNGGLPLSYRPGFGSMPNQLNNAHLNAAMPIKDQSVFGTVEIVPQSVDPELQSAAKKDNTYHISVKLHSHGVPQLAPRQRDDSSASVPMPNKHPDYEVPSQQGTLGSAYPGYGLDGRPSKHHGSRPDLANAPRNQYGSRPDLNNQPTMVTTGGYGPDGPNNRRGNRPDLSGGRPGQGPANQYGSRPDLSSAPRPGVSDGYGPDGPNQYVNRPDLNSGPRQGQGPGGFGPGPNQYGSRPDLSSAPRPGVSDGYGPDGPNQYVNQPDLNSGHRQGQGPGGYAPGYQYGSRPDLSNAPRQGPGGFGPVPNQYGSRPDLNSNPLLTQGHPNRRARSPHPGGMRNSSLTPFGDLPAVPNNVDPYYMQLPTVNRSASPNPYTSAGDPYLSLPSGRQGRSRGNNNGDLPFSDEPNGPASLGRYPGNMPSNGNHVTSIALLDDDDDDMVDSKKPPRRRPRSQSHRDIPSSDGEYIVKSFKPSAGNINNKPNNTSNNNASNNKGPLADAAIIPATSKEPLYTMPIDHTLTMDYVNPHPPVPVFQQEPVVAQRNGPGLYAMPRTNDGYKSSDNEGIIGIDRKGKLLINNSFDSIGRPKFVPLISDQGSDEDEEPNLIVPRTDDNVFDSGYYQPRENPLYASDSDDGELPEVDVDMKLADEQEQHQQHQPQLQQQVPVVKAEMKEMETQTAEKKKSKQMMTQTDEEKQTQTDSFRPKDFKQVQTDTMPKIAEDRRKKQDKDRMDVLNWPGQRPAYESQRPAYFPVNNQAAGDSDMDMFEAPALKAQMSEVEAAPPHIPYGDATSADEEVGLIPIRAIDIRSQERAPIVILEPKQKSESKRQKQQPDNKQTGKDKDAATVKQAAAAAAAPRVRETVVILGELEAQLRLPDGRRLVMVGPGEYMPLGPAQGTDEEDSDVDQPDINEDELDDTYEPVTLNESAPQNNQQPLARQPEKTLRDQVRKVVRDEDGYPIYEDTPAVQLVDVNYEKPRQQPRSTMQDGKRGDKAYVAAGKNAAQQPQQQHQQPLKNNGSAGKSKWMEPEELGHGDSNEDEELPDLALEEGGNEQESSSHGRLNPYWAKQVDKDNEGDGDDIDGVDEFIMSNQQAATLNEIPRENSRDSHQNPRSSKAPLLPAKSSEKGKMPQQGPGNKKSDEKANSTYAKPKKPVGKQAAPEESVYMVPEELVKAIDDDEMMSAPPPVPDKRGSLVSNKNPKSDKPNGKAGDGSNLPDDNKANKGKVNDKDKGKKNGEKPLDEEGDYLVLVDDSLNKNNTNKPLANKTGAGDSKKPEEQQRVGAKDQLDSSKNAPDSKNNKDKNKKKKPDDDQQLYVIPVQNAEAYKLNKSKLGDNRYTDVPIADNVDDDLLYMGEVDDPEYANGQLPENEGEENNYLVPEDGILLQDEPYYESSVPVGFDERDKPQAGNKGKKLSGGDPADLLADEGDDNGRFHPVDFLETDDWDDVPITVNPKRKAFSTSAEPKPKQTVTITEYDIARMFADAPAGSIHQTYNVEHEEEEIMGPLADGAVIAEDGEGSENLLNLDTVSESVELDMKNGWVMMTVRVRSERIVPIRGVDDMFRKSAVIMTRVIAIDLRVSEERRLFYESIVAMSSQEAGGRQRRLDAQETFRLYKAFMGLVEADNGTAMSEHTRIDKRVEEVVHPDLFAADETPTSSTTSLRAAP